MTCADGRVIKKDAFKGQNGMTVPLVWMHNHNAPDNVLGFAHLENRDDGVYAHCEFNNTEAGQTAKELVRHGDVRSLSIFANQLKQAGSDVIHGVIREVSLVLAGANPGAFIDDVLAHGDGENAGIIVGYDEMIMGYLEHSDDEKDPEKQDEGKENGGDSEETVEEVFNTLTEKQKTAAYALIGHAVEDGESENNDDSEGGDETMKHNVFENDQRDNKTY